MYFRFYGWRHICSKAKVARRRRPAEAQCIRSLGLGYKLCAVIPVARQRTHGTTFLALKVASQVATQEAESAVYDCLVFISKKSKSNFWLVQLQLRILKTIYGWRKWLFEFSGYSGYILQVGWTKASLLISNLFRTEGTQDYSNWLILTELFETCCSCSGARTLAASSSGKPLLLAASRNVTVQCPSVWCRFVPEASAGNYQASVWLYTLGICYDFVSTYFAFFGKVLSESR